MTVQYVQYNGLSYEAELILKFGDMHIGKVVEEKLPVEVLSYNKLKNKLEYRRVLNHFELRTKKLVRIKTNNVELFITENHHVFVLGHGYKEAKNIKHSDILFSSEQTQEWVYEAEIIELEKEIITYNIEVENNNNYFADAILVGACVYI